MLLIYRIVDGVVVSISGLRGAMVVPQEAVDSIRLADPLPEGQAEWRIYDVSMMNRIWEASDRGATLEVVLDANGQPIGIKADGIALLQGGEP